MLRLFGAFLVLKGDECWRIVRNARSRLGYLPHDCRMLTLHIMRPVKQILSAAHLEAFSRSLTHQELVQFIDDLNEAVVGVTISQVKISARTQPLIDQLDAIWATAKGIPPVDTQSRFGNAAFRDFYDAIDVRGIVPEAYAEEVGTYLQESWGNRERIDYGSGMELNFLCWLYCHVKLGLVGKEDYAYLVLGVFWRYIQVMRYLQSTYWLEPAGSHGVWGLDDYQFLPFLWGAAQLSGESYKDELIRSQASTAKVHTQPRSPRSVLVRLHVPFLYRFYKLDQNRITAMAFAHVG